MLNGNSFSLKLIVSSLSEALFVEPTFFFHHSVLLEWNIYFRWRNDFFRFQFLGKEKFIVDAISTFFQLSVLLITKIELRWLIDFCHLMRLRYGMYLMN